MNPENGGLPAEVYRRYLEDGKLGFQRCGDCGAALLTGVERASDLAKPPPTC